MVGPAGVQLPVDELPLELDNTFRLAPQLVEAGLLLEEVSVRIAVLDRKLESMSGPRFASLWTPEALRKDLPWDEICRLAAECLANFPRPNTCLIPLQSSFQAPRRPPYRGW